MKIAMKSFFMAALALMTVACSSNDENNFAQQPKTGEGITITAQLAPKSGNAATRALVDKGDNKITVTWAVDEHIAILYEVNSVKNVSDARIKKVDETTGAATIEFTVETGTADNTPCTLIYPLSAANDEHSGLKDVGTLLGTQDGTLNANLDVRVGAGTIHTATPGLTVTTQPEAQFAIFKFTTRNVDGTADINVKQLTITTGTENFVITPADATSTFYAALPPLTEQAVTFVAISPDGHTNLAAFPSISFSAGKYYQSAIKMTKYNNINLTNVQWPVTVQDGNVLTGELGENVKISIANGATVTLNNVTINGTNSSNYYWAGLTCLGDATIILADGTTNSVKGFYQNYPGIYVPEDKTLTIKGNGSLNASSNGWAAGIGGGLGPYVPNAGNININGGNITATGGDYSAGIGSGKYSSCGNISITGGSVTATGGTNSAGIGTGNYYSCGAISITGGSVTATGGANGAGIGTGSGWQSTCGIISITGGTITAKGGSSAASIGTGYRGTCSDITISDAMVTATGGANGAGIGSGEEGTCSDITIMSTVIHVKATRGEGDTKHVGPGKSGKSGKVTIGGKIYWDGENYVTEHNGSYYLHGCGWLDYQPTS